MDASVSIVPDLDDNSDADSIASAMFRDDLSSLAQLIIPSSLLGVLMDDDLQQPYHNKMPPRELMVAFDAHETVEVKYDGGSNTIVSSHDAYHPYVPNGRAVDSVTIVKDSKDTRHPTKQREPGSPTTMTTTSRKMLPSWGLSRKNSDVKTVNPKSKWTSTASLMSYAWRRRAPQPDNSSFIRDEICPTEDADDTHPIINQDETKTERSHLRRHKSLLDPGDLNSVKSASAATLSSFLNFRRNINKNKDSGDDPKMRDYASLDLPSTSRSPRRPRRLLCKGKHRNVGQQQPNVAEEESPLSKTVSSTSVTSSSSTPQLPSIPNITEPNNNSSSMAFFLPQWPVKAEDDKSDEDKDGTVPFLSKKAEEVGSWSKISLFNCSKEGLQQKEEEHVMKHVIMPQEKDEDEPARLPEEREKENPDKVRTAVAKPRNSQRFKLSLPISYMTRSSASHHDEPSKTKIVTVESFDSFYDGVTFPKELAEYNLHTEDKAQLVKQEHDFDAFQEDDENKNHELSTSLDRQARQDRKRGQGNGHVQNYFRSSGRQSRRQNAEPKAPVDSIVIPLLPKSDSAVGSPATFGSWSPALLLCSTPHHQTHRHNNRCDASDTSSLAEDESVFMEINERTALQQHHEKEDHPHDEIDNNEDAGQDCDEKPFPSARRTWFRRRAPSIKSQPRGRAQSAAPQETETVEHAPHEAPFPIVREDYSLNDGSYHVLKIVGRK